MTDTLLMVALTGNVISTAAFLLMEGVKQVAPGRKWARKGQVVAFAGLIICSALILGVTIPSMAHASGS